MDWLNGLFQSLGGAANSIGSGLGNMGGGLMNMFSMGGRGGGSNSGMGQSPMAMLGGQNKGSSGAGGLFSGNPMGSFGAGLGTLGLGQLLGGKTKAPDLNTPQVQGYQNFTHNPPALPQSMQDSINSNLAIKEDQENRQLDATYKSLRPGTDYTTDSNYLRDKANLSRQQQSDRANALMGPTLQYLQPMQQSMADQAQMSLYGPSLQYGQDVARKQAMNQTFGNLGNLFFMNSLWPNLMSGGR